MQLQTTGQTLSNVGHICLSRHTTCQRMKIFYNEFFHLIDDILISLRPSSEFSLHHTSCCAKSLDNLANVVVQCSFFNNFVRKPKSKLCFAFRHRILPFPFTTRPDRKNSKAVHQNSHVQKFQS
jgi:hypothetical protein